MTPREQALQKVVERYVIEAEASGGWKGDDELFEQATEALSLPPSTQTAEREGRTREQLQESYNVLAYVFGKEHVNDPAYLTNLNDLRAAALAAPAPVQGWQPIETAPKDGTVILGTQKHWRGHSQSVYWRQYFDGSKGWACSSGDEVRVTHWMPLPAPAAEDGEKG